jgi:phthiodiolone/phenolphthiodiolone dimycocerosates ketoreductase
MKYQPAAFLRTTLPLDLSGLEAMDSGRYHSIWLPDHMVSFWPDAIWTPEFTDLATTSASPHRHLDGLAVAAAAAALTKNALIATSVVDTVRRHPSLLAQTALTIDHISRGRFVLGLGSGEMENTVPYGFDFSQPVSRLEESLKVIRLLWESDGPIDFEGRFFKMHHARLDTEPFEGRFPRIWLGASGPRMLEITGRYADGWWPASVPTPDDYAAKLATIRQVAEREGRDPEAIVPAIIRTALIGDEAEIAEMVQAPLIKAFLLQMTAETLHGLGFEHPMGPKWKGIHDLNPTMMTRDVILDFISKVDVRSVLAVVPHGTPKEIAKQFKAYVDAGLRVPKILDYGGMAGLKFAAKSPAKVRETEDELQRLIDG